jgi:uncharacterized C2H2 Zn-finger protein
MKLTLPWRNKSKSETESAPVPEKIDISQPRESILRAFRGHPGSCPRCGAALRQQRETYLVATRRGKRLADSFTMGSDFGWLCPQCPTIVINTTEVEKLLKASGWRFDVGEEYSVLGLVDLDAVPPAKRHLPLGDPGNPLPLVRFSNMQPAPPESKPRKKKRR